MDDIQHPGYHLELPTRSIRKTSFLIFKLMCETNIQFFFEYSPNIGPFTRGKIIIMCVNGTEIYQCHVINRAEKLACLEVNPHLLDSSLRRASPMVFSM